MSLYVLREPKCFITSCKHAYPLLQKHSHCTRLLFTVQMREISASTHKRNPWGTEG